MHPEGEEVSETNEARMRLYAEAGMAGNRAVHGYLPCWDEFEAIARAVIAVADEEQAVLHTMVETSEAHTLYWQTRAEAAEAEVERLTRECLDREARSGPPRTGPICTTPTT